MQRCERPLICRVHARVILDQEGGDIHMLDRTEKAITEAVHIMVQYYGSLLGTSSYALLLDSPIAIVRIYAFANDNIV